MTCPSRKLDRDREAIIDHHCILAELRAQEDGRPATAVVCAGRPWCSNKEAGCAWCTRIVVSPDGSRARVDPHHA